MTVRALSRIPNPFPLSRWAQIFRAAAALRMFSLALYALAAAASGTGVGDVLAFVFGALIPLAETLILLSVADLLRRLAGARGRPGLAIRLAPLLYTAAALQAAWFALGLVIFFIDAQPGPRVATLTATGVLTSASLLAWASIYGVSGLLASRLVKALLSPPDPALSMSAQARNAVRRGAACDTSVLYLPALLTGAGIAIAVCAAYGALAGIRGFWPHLGGLAFGMYDPVPNPAPVRDALVRVYGFWPHHAPGAPSFPGESSLFFPAHALPGLVTATFAAWLRFMANPSRAARLAESFPPLLWIYAGLYSLFFLASALSASRSQMTYALPGLLGTAWMTALTGVGFAARHILIAPEPETEAHGAPVRNETALPR